MPQRLAVGEGMKTTETEEWKLSNQLGRDMHPWNFVEAICAHGIGHHRGVHGCDGCCANMPEEILDKTTKDL